MERYEVQIAKPYSFGCLGSLARSSNVLLRQFEFPRFYERLDAMAVVYSDRLLQWNYDRNRRIIKEFTGSGDQHVFEFLKAVMDCPAPSREQFPGVEKWTGFRVMGHVHLGNGYNLCTFELFGRHPESATEVYTGGGAPNVDRSTVFVPSSWGGTWEKRKPNSNYVYW